MHDTVKATRYNTLVSDTRKAILDASVALVAEQGVRAVSFREVARRAGVSHQTPYHHFGDHLGILRAIAAEGFEALNAAMDDAAKAEGSDSLAALHASGIAYVRFAREHVGHFRVMFQETLVDLHDATDPIVAARATSETLARLARAAHASGHGSTLDADAMAHLCWSTVHGVATLLVEGTLARKTKRTSAEQTAFAETVVGSLTELLRAPKRARSR